MKMVRYALVAAGLAFGVSGVFAQSTKPGLWEISNKMSSSSGEMEKAMSEAQKQMANMPAEQRKMMMDMMAKQGVSMGSMGAGGAGTVVKVCLTKEMVDRNDFTQQAGDCKHTMSPRVGNAMKFSFACTNPQSSGEGQVTFNGSDAYAMKMDMSTSAHGKPEKMHMESTGKFLSSDCGSIKPITMPKK